MITMCGPECTMDDKNSYRGCGDPQHSYEGRVLATGERNGHDDSDFYALVWDDEQQRIIQLEYASTRGWTYHNGASVDATPDTFDQALRWFRAQYAQVMIARAHAAVRTPGKGKRVRSTTTSGRNVGVEGVVMWVGTNQYRRHGRIDRYGIKVEGESGLRYLDWDRLVVVDPEPVDEDAVAAEAAQARPANWRSALFALHGVA